jgi:hypothetical protein
MTVLGSIMVVACTSNTAPPDFLPKAKMAGESVHGGWVDARVRADSTTRMLRGELLAISSDSLWIQTPTDSGFVIARSAIVSGKIIGYRPQGSVEAWTLLGVLSTVANGWFLIITAPAWMLTGGFSHYGDVRAAERDLPDDFDRPEIDLRAVARFPQGMPPRMDAPFRRLPPPR